MESSTHDVSYVCYKFIPCPFFREIVCIWLGSLVGRAVQQKSKGSRFESSQAAHFSQPVTFILKEDLRNSIPRVLD